MRPTENIGRGYDIKLLILKNNKLYQKSVRYILRSECVDLLKAHYATSFAKMSSIMQVESYSDGSTTISGSFGGCFIAPCRFSKEKANMQLALFKFQGGRPFLYQKLSFHTSERRCSKNSQIFFFCKG